MMDLAWLLLAFGAGAGGVWIGLFLAMRGIGR